MPTIDEVCAATDTAMALCGLHLSGSGYLARPYRGQIAGCQATGQLSVFTDANDHTEAASYRLTVEVQTGVPARLAAGRNIPILVKRNLPTLESPWPTLPGLSLMAHDTGWARRFVDDAALVAAITAVLQRAEFVEHRPGLLQVQIAGRHPAADGLPATMNGLGTLTQGVLRPPGPTPATTRWSDNRGIVVAVAAVLFLGAIAVAIAAYWMIT